MPVSAETGTPGFQARFHRRWNHLNDPHVRTLAWLLDSPDLLDPHSAEWAGRIASVGAVDGAIEAWLTGLDQEPGTLHAYLDLKPFARLGRYAEKLMAFYLEHRGWLVAHGVQVRVGKNDTVGEFDFLLRQDKALIHWEFATKLFLLESSGHGCEADYFIGPGLVDTLGTKIRKIMARQLALSRHPAALLQLTEPIAAAQALLKGWLFYHERSPMPALPSWISPQHCRGFWRALEELDEISGQHFVVLPRLSWLAPAKLAIVEAALDREALRQALTSHFAETSGPALVAVLESEGGHMLESDRGFIVPNDWRTRAEAKISQAK
ncbi:MAG TPA: DUF1853 family protein [Noviherbaspirillum sp.]|uniref:DUF1853 family protein n=1 Tax=Noviherbaspirillum sp. TaxID=1926288 RepID=UPI002B481370|nr:DUF1853 family protein [Noviherbaspirillum sp.]HJV84904.1 DUF1853 family protein [Noviherbaspirillum sp.]